MGLFEGNSPECEYVFMRPTSIPVSKFNVKELATCKKQDCIYMVPRPSKPATSAVFKMIDMSELIHSPERPEVTIEVVKPDQAKPEMQNRTQLRLTKANPVERFPKPNYRDQCIMKEKSEGKSKLQGYIEEENKYANVDEVKSNNHAMKEDPESFIDINRNIRLKNSNYKFASETSNGLHRHIACSEHTYDHITSEMTLYDGNIDNEVKFTTDANPCYFYPCLQSCSPSLPTYDPPSPPTVSPGQRRLPPTPDENEDIYYNDEVEIKFSERSNKPLRFQSVFSLPDSNDSSSTSLNDFSKARIEHDTSQDRSISSLDLKTSKKLGGSPLESKTPDSSPTKSKVVSSIAKNLFSISSVFGKSQKHDLNKNDENLLSSKQENFEKPNRMNPSQKSTKKIHPVADMIRKRRTMTQCLLQSSSALAKSSQNSEKSNLNKELKNSSAAGTPSRPNISKKPNLKFSQSLPLLCAPNAADTKTRKKRFISEHSPSTNDSVDLDQENFVESQIQSEDGKTFPKMQPKHHQRSFLYQKSAQGPKMSKIAGQAKTSSPKANFTRSQTFDSIPVDSFQKSFYENLSSVQNFSESTENLFDKLPTFCETPDTNASVSQQLNEKKTIQTKTGLESGKVAQQKETSHFLANSKETSSSSTAIKPRLYLTKQLSETHLRQVRKIEPPMRPPPPSLKKIREARLKSNWRNNGNGKTDEASRTQSEMRVSTSPKERSPSELRSRFALRSKCLTGPDLQFLDDDDSEYSTIPDISNQVNNHGNEKSINAGMRPKALITSRFQRSTSSDAIIDQSTVNMKTNIKNMIGSSIYEDIDYGMS